MAASPSISNIASNFPFPIHYLSQLYIPMFSFCFFVLLFTSFLFVFWFFVYKRLKNIQHQTQQTQLTQKPKQSDPIGLQDSIPETLDKAHQAFENNPTHLTHSAHSLLLEILPSDSPKWASLFENEGSGDSNSNGTVLDRETSELGGDQRAKKKKKRTKKKSSNSKGEENGEHKCAVDRGSTGPGSGPTEDLVCLYPFTSSSSATQRKIKQQYDQLMKCHESKGLTLSQVFCFVGYEYISFSSFGIYYLDNRRKKIISLKFFVLR